MLNHHVEPELIVHDRPQTHDAHVDVVRRVAHLELSGVAHELGDPGPVQVQTGALLLERGGAGGPEGADVEGGLLAGGGHDAGVLEGPRVVV